MSHFNTQETYSRIRDGVRPDQTPLDFIEHSALAIIDLSARQAAAALGLSSHQELARVEKYMGSRLISDVRPLYNSRTNRFHPGTQLAVKKLATERTGQLIREYLPTYLATALLKDVTNSPMGAIQQARFQVFVDFAKSLVPEMDGTNYAYGREETLNTVSADIGRGDYQDRVLAQLALAFDGSRELTSAEVLLVQTSLRHANAMWQIAQPLRYASELYTLEAPPTVSTRLEQDDFTSFDEMPGSVYHNRLAKYSPRHAALLTAFKLFQDAGEYHQP